MNFFFWIFVPAILKISLKEFKYLGINCFGLKIHLINQPKYKLSIKEFIGACCLVKKEIAAPVQIINGL